MDETCVVFLKGVSIEDYKEVEDQFDERLMQNEYHAYDSSSFEIYDTIPSTFEGLDKWPESTNLKCWNCDFTFASRPVFIPINISEYKEGEMMTNVYGNFCTFSCAARFIKDYMPKELNSNLVMLSRIFNKNDGINIIYPSPQRTIMKKYGGTISDEKYVETIQLTEKMMFNV